MSKIIKELEDRICGHIVEMNNEYYYIDSCLTKLGHEYETSIFSCNKDGSVDDWQALYEEKYPSEIDMVESHIKIINNLEKYLDFQYSEENYYEEDEYYEDKNNRFSDFLGNFFHDIDYESIEEIKRICESSNNIKKDLYDYISYIDHDTEMEDISKIINFYKNNCSDEYEDNYENDYTLF
jgi:hypothetical protein